MEKNFNPDNFEQDSLDEILFRDPPNARLQNQVTNGMSKRKEVITFADGSQLVIAAQVTLPPLADMTPSKVFFIKPNGEKGERWDDGSSEALVLSGQSIAMRFMAWISQALDEFPEREKVTCSACSGNRRCLFCNGQGCVNCQASGRCPSCDGRGQVPKE